MPAKSKAQRMAMAIAEHHPQKLYKRNRGMLAMSKGQMHEFAVTKAAGLPARAKMSKSKRAMRDRSTRGSPPMTMKEMACGYRRMV